MLVVAGLTTLVGVSTELFHEYVVAPVACSVEAPPEHTRVLLHVAFTVGFGFTSTTWLANETQPNDVSVMDGVFKVRDDVLVQV
jgi:hypothetical protein